METKRKSNSVVQVVQDGSILTFNVLGAGSIEFDTRKVHEDNLQRAIMHGFKQRLSDAAALSRNPENGQPASPADKFAAIQELAEFYMSGAEGWSRRAEGRAGPVASITLQAIARVKGCDMTAAEAMIGKLAGGKFSGDRKAALTYLRKGSKVQEAMQEIRAERAGGGDVDADEMLDGLE